MLQSCKVAKMQSCNVEMLQGCNVAMLQCCNVAMLQCCKVAMLQCCNVAMLYSCNVALLQSCNVAMWQSYKVATLLRTDGRMDGRTVGLLELLSQLKRGVIGNFRGLRNLSFWANRTMSAPSLLDIKILMGFFS